MTPSRESGLTNRVANEIALSPPPWHLVSGSTIALRTVCYAGKQGDFQHPCRQKPVKLSTGVVESNRLLTGIARYGNRGVTCSMKICPPADVAKAIPLVQGGSERGRS